MNKDIRLSVDFLTHRKRKKLQRELGSDGVLSLIDLWLSTARQRPSGTLTEYDEIDIELDANWNGEDGLFVKTLLKLGLLDDDNGVYSLHNWSDRQGWVVGSDERGDKARFSRLAKVNPRLFRELKEKGVCKISKDDYKKLNETSSETSATVEETSNETSTTVNETLNETSTTVEETITPAPAPAPAPSPAHNALKESPESESPQQKTAEGKNDSPPPGISFKDLKTKLKNKQVTATSHNNGKRLDEYFQRINQACNDIAALPKKRKKFDPYKWAQQQIGKSKHPGAIMESLEGLIMFWDSAHDPWAYALNILGKKDGTFNEQDAIAHNEELKNMKPNQLEFLTQGLLQEMPS